jgi:hypothetical protein
MLLLMPGLLNLRLLPAPQCLLLQLKQQLLKMQVWLLDQQQDWDHRQQQQLVLLLHHC